MKELTPLFTRWGAEIDKNCPLPEHPRPQLRREGWRVLNGIWEYAIRDGTDGAEPDKYDGEILVPYSPESLLSGVNRQLLPGQTLWYRRELSIEAPMEGRRLLLHFGAVDQRCDVYVNGHKSGSHEGGYWPFTLDVTDFARNGANTLAVAVRDDSDTGREAYGKQRLKRGGIWYTPQSGIWQTVWAESVPEQYIRSIKITPNCETSEVSVRLGYSQSGAPQAHIAVFDGGSKPVAEGRSDGGACILALPGFRFWSCDDPFLYTLRITAGDDVAESYFGMRQFGVIEGHDGLPRLSLNGKPVFHSGLLDQGYWSDGIYTPPGDEAMAWEISLLRQMGFNMLRKHIKIEPLRWYYHCDRLGMLVWQDFVSGGEEAGEFKTRYLPPAGKLVSDEQERRRGFGQKNKEWCAVYERDMARTVELLYNTVCLSVWVPFNEGWGQFDAARIAEKLREMDDTRLIDHASGWHDQGAGDFDSRHVYFKPFRLKPDKLGRRSGLKRIQALTEFGGYSCPAEGHMTSDSLFGYRMFDSTQELTDAFEKLYENEVIPAVARGLSAAVYTQVSDVEDEVNGLLTYDRAELKVDKAVAQRVNKALNAALEDCC